jgi:hypothetical protein
MGGRIYVGVLIFRRAAALVVIMKNGRATRWIDRSLYMSGNVECLEEGVISLTAFTWRLWYRWKTSAGLMMSGRPNAPIP